MNKKIEWHTENYEINQTNPWKDSLEREEFGKFFCDYLITSPSPSTVELSAGYGQGKTIFVKRCEKVINNDEKKKAKAIYLNIWEQDYNDNPILSLLQAFNTDGKIKSFLNLGRNKGLLKKIISFGSKKFSAIKTGIEFDITDFFPEEEKSNQHFIQKLKNKIKTISKNERLIIFVDELDRCRPDYAIRTLEIIKHIFNIENIVFVISTDDNRLKASVESIYGTQTSNEDYLRKFIDIQFNLPDTDEIEKKRKAIGNYLAPNIYQLLLSPSLREISAIQYSLDNFFNGLEEVPLGEIDSNIIRKFNKHNNHKESKKIIITAYVFMVMLRHMKPDLYFKIGNKGIWDSASLSQLKLNNTYLKNGFIKNREDFKEFLRCVCTPKDEIDKFVLKNIFNKQGDYINLIKNTDNWTLEDLRENSIKYDDNLIVFNNAITLWCHKYILDSKKSLAQICFKIIEDLINKKNKPTTPTA